MVIRRTFRWMTLCTSSHSLDSKEKLTTRAAKVSSCDQKALHRSVKLCQHWFSLYFFFFFRRLLFSTHEFTYSFRPWSGKPLACSIAPLSPLLPPPLPERAVSGQSSPRLKKAAKNSRFTLGISLVFLAKWSCLLCHFANPNISTTIHY